MWVIQGRAAGELAGVNHLRRSMDQAQANELVRRTFSEVIDGGDYSLIPHLFDEDFQDHGPMGDTRGHEAFIEMLEGFRAALPGFRHEIEDVTLLGDDTVAFHVRTIATFSGEMMGVWGQGQEIDLWFINGARLRNGKVLEHWGPGPEGGARLMAAMGLAEPAPA
jgi:predicted ester cyclase